MSCKNNLKEFDHPEYGILDPAQVGELRDELTRCFIDYIGGLSNHIKEKETLDIKDRTTRFHFIRVCTIIKDLNEIDPGWCLRYFDFIRVCTIIKDLNEIDPGWCLRYFEPDDECLKIKLHDCKCCYHTCQNSDKVTQSPKSNSNKSSQVKDKESTQE